MMRWYVIGWSGFVVILAVLVGWVLDWCGSEVPSPEDRGWLSDDWSDVEERDRFARWQADYTAGQRWDV